MHQVNVPKQLVIDWNFAVLYYFQQFPPQIYLHTSICKVKLYICWSNLHMSQALNTSFLSHYIFPLPPPSLPLQWLYHSAVEFGFHEAC